MMTVVRHQPVAFPSTGWGVCGLTVFPVLIAEPGLQREVPLKRLDEIIGATAPATEPRHTFIR